MAGKDEEERRIAEMGRPMLGDHVKLEVIIEESYEFKVRQDCMLVCVWECVKGLIGPLSFWQCILSNIRINPCLKNSKSEEECLVTAPYLQLEILLGL